MVEIRSSLQSLQSNAIRVKIVGYERDHNDGHVEYIFDFSDSSGNSFRIQDRYSSIRAAVLGFRSRCKVKKFKPSFPGKKVINSRKQHFVEARGMQLANYFERLL